MINKKFDISFSNHAELNKLFSFYDQNYTEYALRSDLSIASVIKFIKDKNQKKTKWSYSGEAYRKQNKNNQNGHNIKIPYTNPSLLSP